MKALHEMDAAMVAETLRPDFQRIHEDEPQNAAPSLGRDMNTIVGGIFGAIFTGPKS